MVPVQKLSVRFLLFLFAIASICFQGYIFGYHDHSVQIPYIWWKLNPSLYPRDLLSESFPYYFALVWDWVAWASLYIPLKYLLLILHIFFRWLFFESLYYLGLTLSNNKITALLSAAAFLFPLHTLGDWVPSPAFVHANVALPGVIYALAFFFRGKILLSFILVGLLFNVHVMHAVFLGFVLFFILLRRREVFRTFQFWTGVALGVLLALPTFIPMAKSIGFPVGPDWINVIRLRAAHHIFPFTWTWPWLSFCIYLFCGYQAFRRISIHYRQESVMVGAAVLTLCIIGIVFSEIYPIPFIMRMHIFRSVVIFIIVLTVLISHYFANELLIAKRQAAFTPYQAFLIIGTTALIYSAYIPLLASSLYLSSKRRNAILPFVGLILLFPFMVWALTSLQYAVPLSSYFKAEALKVVVVLMTSVLLSGLLFHEQLYPVFKIPVRPTRTISYLGLIILSLLVIYWKERIRTQDDFVQRLPEWIDVQVWARDHSNPDDCFLTPPKYEGFRVFSRRSIIADWKDGTASFWYPPLASRWLERMIELHYIDRDTLHVIDRYESLSREEILNLSRRYNCCYAVFLRPVKESLTVVYYNREFVVYSIP